MAASRSYAGGSIAADMLTIFLSRSAGTTGAEMPKNRTTMEIGVGTVAYRREMICVSCRVDYQDNIK